MARSGPGDKSSKIDLHELCIEGDYAGLKSALEENKELDINEYKLFVYRPLRSNCNEMDNLIDVEDDYQSDEEESDFFKH